VYGASTTQQQRPSRRVVGVGGDRVAQACRRRRRRQTVGGSRRQQYAAMAAPFSTPFSAILTLRTCAPPRRSSRSSRRSRCHCGARANVRRESPRGRRVKCNIIIIATAGNI